MKIRLVEAALMHAEKLTDVRTDGRTDMATLIGAFRNYANAPKNFTLFHRIFM